VVAAVAASTGCAGVLVDTWDKAQPSPVGPTWEPWLRHVERAGLFLAIAGGLDAAAIERLAPLRPRWFAVRGAACTAADRRGAIDPQRVSALIRALSSQQVASQNCSKQAQLSCIAQNNSQSAQTRKVGSRRFT
jgi:uncharacterized protein (UPF0264 family)